MFPNTVGVDVGGVLGKWTLDRVEKGPVGRHLENGLVSGTTGETGHVRDRESPRRGGGGERGVVPTPTPLGPVPGGDTKGDTERGRSPV